MRVLIHTGNSYPNGGPAANRLRVFEQVLTEHGHEVVVLAPYNDIGDEKSKNVYYCPTVKLKNKTSVRRLFNQLIFAFTSIFVSLRTGKSDIVFTTSPPALIVISGFIISKIKKAKLVYDVRDIWPDVAWEMEKLSENGFASKIFEVIRDFMLKKSDMVTTVSPGKVKKLREYAPKARVRFITNGLDERFLENSFQSEIADKYGFEKTFSCVYIGNLGWAQGLTQLLYVAKRAKENALEAKFYLFGKGIEEDSLKSFAKEHELDNVIFAGRLKNSSMYTVLKCADLSFVSLVNENLKDSVPTKLYEALGVGCPVLLASAGDSADVLAECGLGVSVRPNDNEAIWEAFKEIYENRNMFDDKKEHARNVILSKYSRRKASEILERELSEIL